MTATKDIHVLGLSGGQDSAALAVHMSQRHPEKDIIYYFTDTGKELPEVYEYLPRLEGMLGKAILRLGVKKERLGKEKHPFDLILKKHNYFLPSPQARWCTVMMKLKPFEAWVKPMLEAGHTVISYVAIRSDEEYREGYKSKHDNLIVRLPFKEDGIDKQGVKDILENSGIGRPKYYDWRSRSGCTFCFFQQKIEWVRLAKEHPLAFEEAMAYEKLAINEQSPFTWSEGEALSELIKDKRVREIEEEHQARIERFYKKAMLRRDPLRPNKEPPEMEDLYGQSKVCLACHK